MTSTATTVAPETVGPNPMAVNHDPIRLKVDGPLSKRAVSTSAPQMAPPAANGRTRSPQFGHRVRSRGTALTG